MKKVVLSLLLCFMASAIYSQTIDVIHLKSGLDARGTIISRTENQITVQIENGKTLSFDMTDIESMEQEEAAFNPRALIGRWHFYYSNGKRDELFDVQIEYNHGLYTAKYKRGISYPSSTAALGETPEYIWYESTDIDFTDNITFRVCCVQSYEHYSGSNREYEGMHVIDDYVFSLKYVDEKLVGEGICIKHWRAFGNSKYETVVEANDHGCAKVIESNNSGGWKCYFMKN